MRGWDSRMELVIYLPITPVTPMMSSLDGSAVAMMSSDNNDIDNFSGSFGD